MSSTPVIAYIAVGPADELARNLAAEIMHDLQTRMWSNTAGEAAFLALLEPKARLLGKIARGDTGRCWPHCKPVVKKLQQYAYYDLAAAIDPFY